MTYYKKIQQARFELLERERLAKEQQQPEPEQEAPAETVAEIEPEPATQKKVVGKKK